MGKRQNLLPLSCKEERNLNLADKYVNRNDFTSYEDFFQNYKVTVPENFNFAFDVIDEMAKLVPDETAMVWCNVKGDEKVFTYRDMMEKSNQCANMLKKHGIKRGDTVLVILKRNYQYWFTILALHKIGAITVPATHLLSTKDIVYRNNAADVKMIITTDESEVMEHVEASQSESPTLQSKILVGAKRDGWIDYMEELEKQSTVFERPTGKEATTIQDTMLLYFTSGTTGYPKMVTHNFSYPLAHIITARYWQNTEEGGLHLTTSDTGWAKAAWGKIYGQWLNGTAIFVYDYDRFVPHELLEVIAKYKVTTFCAPPTIYRFLIKEDFSKYDLSHLKYCAVAGEPLNPEVFDEFYRRTGIKLMEGFGQTETTVQLATFPWLEPKPGSMGKPSPNYHIELLNFDGKPCKEGEEGEICIMAQNHETFGLFSGYYKDKERTDSVWHDGIYHTGDIAWRDEDGYYWFVGRSDDVIKSSGYRIGPFEVESALMEHPAVLETAITGVPDPDKGRVVKATIVLAKGYTPSDELKKELQTHVKTVTAPYKYPRIIEFVDELPKTISGKIKRYELRNEKRDHVNN